MQDVIVVINVGSSTVKFSIFDCSDIACCLKRDNIPCSSRDLASLNQAVDQLLDQLTLYQIKAVGHRVVHGGQHFFQPTRIDADTLMQLEQLVPLAPDHLTPELQVVRAMQAGYPDTPQIACFDTAFHTTQPRLATLFALPRKLTEEGIVRYGFHGLSYEYIASSMGRYLPEKHASGRVVIAHLGNGASLCAVKEGRSVATTMGFTALDGLMMGTRCGAIDAGVVFYLAQHKGMSLDDISHLLNRQSGLLGVSGLSSDMRELEQSATAEAKEALDLFAYRAAREVGSLCTALNGLDALIFTGGIGEHSAATRSAITGRLQWLGAAVDEAANNANEIAIHSRESALGIYVIPTDEEQMIARHTQLLINKLESNHD